MGTCAKPRRTAAVMFSHDSALQSRWPAVRYGRTWNGFLTPVVTLETATAVLRDLEEPVTISPAGVLIGDDFTLTPNGLGQYDLASLGFRFHAVSSDESQ